MRNNLSFAHNLFDLVNYCDIHAKDVACWSEDGTELIIKNPSELENSQLPRFFEKRPKFSSFRKQLNNYGFSGRSENHPKVEIFCHEKFRQGEEAPLREIRKKESKSHPSNLDPEMFSQMIDERIRTLIARLEQAREQEIKALKQEVQELRKRVADLEKQTHGDQQISSSQHNYGNRQSDASVTNISTANSIGTSMLGTNSIGTWNESGPDGMSISDPDAVLSSFSSFNPFAGHVNK